MAVVLIISLWFSTTASYAQQNLDDILGGFEETSPDIKKEEPPPVKSSESVFDFTGSATLGAAYNHAHKTPMEGKTDYRGLSRLRAELLLELETRLSENWKTFIGGKGFYDLAYTINGRDEYTSEVLNSYEKEAELRDVYILGKLSPSLDIKIGRQIVVWGKSDNIRVTDILNPLDNREPGMVDIKDLRLPVFATKLDYYFGQWSLSAIAVNEIRFNKNPAFGSDFYSFDFPPSADEVPASSLDNTEYALALNGIFSGWDISFYLAKIFDDKPHMERNGFAMVRSHSRLTMFGMAANAAFGNWLLKTEAAYFDGLEFFNIPGEQKARYDILIGMEYAGFTDSMISFEAVNRRIMDYSDKMGAAPDLARKDEVQFAFRYSADYLHDRLHILALLSVFGRDGNGGGFERFSVEYDILDSLSVTGGMVVYQSGDYVFFQNIGDNDRLFVNLRFSF